MGRRSQIYIRYNGKLIVANYYQWNYGERMISRCRSILDYLGSMLEYKFMFSDENEIETLKRYCDVNFDYRDIVRSHDIFKEWSEYARDTNINDWFYLYQDNNDGQLFIDIIGNIIKYAFRVIDYESITQKYTGAVSASEYWSRYSGYYSYKGDNEITKMAQENVDFIESNYELMTDEELNQFLTAEIEIENQPGIKSSDGLRKERSSELLANAIDWIYDHTESDVYVGCFGHDLRMELFARRLKKIGLSSSETLDVLVKDYDYPEKDTEEVVSNIYEEEN